MAEKAKRKILPAWVPSALFLKQETHFAFGLALPFAARALGYPTTYGVALILAVSFLKELLLDPWLEGAPFLWDGAEDFGFYLVGIVAALAMLAARWGPPGLLA